MSAFADRPLPPVTALDDLIAESAMERPRPLTLADLLSPRGRRRCPDCGAIGGHTSVHCPGNEG